MTFYTISSGGAKLILFSILNKVKIVPTHIARRGGAEVEGWTLDRTIRVRFPAYPHCVWAI